MYQPLLESFLFDFFSFLQPPLGHETFRQKYSSFPKKYEHLRKKEGVGGGGEREREREKEGEGRWGLPPCVAFFEEKEESLGFLVRCLERKKGGEKGEGERKVGIITFLRETPSTRFLFLFLFFYFYFIFILFVLFCLVCFFLKLFFFFFSFLFS